MNKLNLYTPLGNFMKPTGLSFYRSFEKEVKNAVSNYERQGLSDREQIEYYILSNTQDFLNKHKDELEIYDTNDVVQLFQSLVHGVCNDTICHNMFMTTGVLAGDEQDDIVVADVVEDPIPAISKPKISFP